MHQVRIVDRETREVVHRIDRTYDRDSSRYDRFLRGLYGRVDLDRFDVDDAAEDAVRR